MYEKETRRNDLMCNGAIMIPRHGFNLYKFFRVQTQVIKLKDPEA